MNPIRRALILLLALLPAVALAQPRPGTDYMVLDRTQQVERADKVDVIAFFWYGCIHCYNLEPQLEAWIQKLPADTSFRRVPAILSQNWARDAAIYYAFEALGLVDKLHRPLFDAIHRDRLRTDNPEAFNQWLAKHGVDTKKFDETLKSFSVESKARRAAQLTVAYRIDGTPAMAVHGKYVIGGGPNILDTTDYLIGVARGSLAAKK